MKKLLLLLVILSSLSLQAQGGIERVTNDQTQFWTSVNGTMRLSQKFGVITDFHLRRNNFLKDPSFYFLRLGGAYWVNDQFSFAGGIAALWRAVETDSGFDFALERRTYQQVLWRAVMGKLTFLQRIRIEQRWQEILDETNGSVDRTRFTNRFRFLVSASVQAFPNPKAPRPTISNEILFHVGEEVVLNTFDQNRLFVGFNQRLNKSWTMDYGYMMVYQQQYSGFEYDLNHTIRLFFYYSPDFRKDVDDQLPHYPVGGIE